MAVIGYSEHSDCAGRNAMSGARKVKGLLSKKNYATFVP